MNKQEGSIAANPIYDLGGAAVNITAANAIKGGYSHEVGIDPYDSIAPIPLFPLRPGQADLVGTRVGWLKVLGSTGKKPRKKRACTWVVRCVCGTYSIRTTTAIRNPENQKDACGRCRRISQIKSSYVYHKTGREQFPENFRR